MQEVINKCGLNLFLINFMLNLTPPSGNLLCSLLMHLDSQI